MKRAVLVVWFVFIAALGGTAWWYLFAPGSVPEGQKPLGDPDAFRHAFQAAPEKQRLVALLSPTTPEDLVIAQQVQALLMEYENNPLEAHIVWQKKANSDWAPTTDAMARVGDPRVRQYWDRDARVASTLGSGTVLLYSRGASLQEPALRILRWEDGVGKARILLGTPLAARAQ